MSNILTQDNDLKALLKGSKTIAVVGLSPDPSRPSYEVAIYLQARGYQIIPVRPDADEILGEKAYASLMEIPFPVDIVDIFRKAEFIPAIVDEAIKIRSKAVWMQLGLSHAAAAKKASDAGLKVVQDRCLLIEHRRLIS